MKLLDNDIHKIKSMAIVDIKAWRYRIKNYKNVNFYIIMHTLRHFLIMYCILVTPPIFLKIIKESILKYNM